MSGKCYQCGKTTRVKMIQVAYPCDCKAQPCRGTAVRIEYLCAPCRRELGYEPPRDNQVLGAEDFR
jgi:hypothetical protein